MAKHILYILALATLVLAGCRGDGFKVEGELHGLGTQNVRLVYVGDGVVNDEVVAAREGKFAATGHSAQTAVVSVLDARGTLIARFAAGDGDKVTLTGDAGSGRLAAATGNEANEQWTTFRREHADLYDQAPCDALDRAIERWAGAHRQSLTSALLLLYDHSDLTGSGQVPMLLDSLAPQARPPHMTASVEALNNYFDRHAANSLHTLTLVGADGDFATVNLTGRPTLLYCWSKGRGARRDVAGEVRSVRRERPAIDVVGILLDADTLGWSTACRADSATWPRYWAPAGPMEASLKALRIPRAPWVLAVDSRGRITYRGPSAAEAAKHL